MFSFNLREREKLLAMTRQSEMVLAKYVIGIMLALYFPITFLYQYELLGRYRWLVLIWIVLIAAFSVQKYFLWLLNVSLLTDERVVIISYAGLFAKEISEAPLENISHISQKTKGFFSTLFRYGDILLQLQGASSPLVIRNIRQPGEMVNHIWENAKKRRKNGFLPSVAPKIPDED